MAAAAGHGDDAAAGSRARAYRAGVGPPQRQQGEQCPARIAAPLLSSHVDYLSVVVSELGPSVEVVQYRKSEICPRVHVRHTDPVFCQRNAAWPEHGIFEVQGNEIWLVKLVGVDSPEDADALRGHALLVRADDRPPLEDADEFYVQV